MNTRLLMSALLMLSLASLAIGQTNESTNNRSTWSWINQDGDQKIEVKVENKVEFNDDYSDVSNIPGDGALKIYDGRGAHRFRLLITRGALRS